MQFNRQTGPRPHWLLMREASKVANSTNEQIIAAMAMRANGVTPDEIKACFGRSYTSKLIEIQYRPHVKTIMLENSEETARVKMWVR